MKTYYFKIRDKFIDSVRNGEKRHEYRLASIENREIKIGDNLILISNTNKESFVRTTVKGIRLYIGWEEALHDNWQEDFKDIFSSLDEALKECDRFYRRDEVKEFGIISFDIEPVITDYFNTSVLLDTNIIIKRESGNNASFVVTNLFNWLDRYHIQKYVHELTLKELNTYKDEKIREIILTKMKAYETLPKFPVISDEFFDRQISVFSNDGNGKIDNALLREVYNDNVGLLLTDDFQMLKKAELLYIRDRVLSSNELLEKFETRFPQNIDYKMLAVKQKRFDEIDLEDHFFDTLREDYEGQKFDRWFKKKGNEKAYVFEDKDGLKGFLYLKNETEDEPDYLKITPHLSPKKRMKIGTFKIIRSGFRLGERFLKIIFDNARQACVSEIYVTLFEDKREDVKHLERMMFEWGFYKYGTKENGEVVLLKSMEIYDNSRSPKYNYPIVKEDARYYFLPIFPDYHTDLFPDLILKNEDMHLYEENKAHRYALEKVYLSGVKNVQASPGDIVLIYRIGNRYPQKYSSVVTGIAVIESITETHSVEDCVALCKNRSIFEEQEVRSQYKKRRTVVKLLDHTPLKTKVTLNKLYENGIVEPAKGPRSFEEISKENFETIMQLGMRG
ncbi:MAG: ASCH domain-containing protein [Alphaproteobacteria bacterium]|nr:ASCH domain-containing protein [Alphaproteobacteria bacterium]